ncbi:MAG: autotransporter-associated beta strand repeat-containing protein [Phycisphaerae bacterium]|nr:autotransporter-associated beta strand repeat-containing protein [Phycisphaerae bacterium]
MLKVANWTDSIATYGMVSPSILAASNDFIDYTAATGFRPVTYVTAWGTCGSAGILGTAGGDNTGIGQIYALKTSASVTGSTPLGIGSGGLIVTNNATFTPAITFGVLGGAATEGIVHVSAGTATFSDAITANGLTKSGAGAMTLSADNSATLTGPFTVNAGTVTLGNASALSSANNVVVNGGELNMNGLNASIGSLTMAGGLITNRVLSTTPTLALGGNVTYNGQVQASIGPVTSGERMILDLGSARRVFDVADGLAGIDLAVGYSGYYDYHYVTVTGTGGLTKNGSGRMDIYTDAAGPHTFSGGVIVNGGMLYGTMTGAASTPLGASTNTFALTGNCSIGVNEGGSGYSASYAALTFSGGNTIATVTGQIGAWSWLTFANITRSSRGTMIFQGSYTDGNYFSYIGSNNGIRSTAWDTTSPVFNGMLPGYYVMTGFQHDNTIANFTTYAGNTVTQAAFDQATLVGGTGTKKVNLAAAENLGSDLSIWALRTSSNITGTATLTLSADTDTTKLGGLLINGNVTIGPNTKSGTNGNKELPVFVADARTATLSGTVTAAGVTKFGPGTLVLSGDNSGTVLSGSMYVQAGTLAMGSATALGVDRIPVKMATGSTLKLSGYSPTLTGLYGDGTAMNGSAGTASTLTLNVALGDDHTFSGRLTNGGAGALGLTKTGEGVLTLIGSASDYTGPTAIDGGAVVAGSNSALGRSEVTVGGSGILDAGTVTLSNTIRGTGTITGGILAGTVAPGNSPGTLTLDGATTVTGTYEWLLSSLTDTGLGGVAGTNWSQLLVSGSAGRLTFGSGSSLALSGSSVQPSADAFWNSSHDWTIASATGGAASITTSPTVNNSVWSATEGDFTVSPSGGNLVLHWAPQVPSVIDGVWTSPVNPEWNVNGHWGGGAGLAPGLGGAGNVDSATFNVDSSVHAVSLNQAPTGLKAVTFSGDSGYTIRSSNPGTVKLVLKSDTGTVTLTASGAGVHEISAPVVLASGILAKEGSGELTLSGPMTLTDVSSAAINVNAGRLNVNGSVPGSVSVSVNNDAQAYFGVSQTLASVTIGSGPTDTGRVTLSAGVRNTLVTGSLSLASSGGNPVTTLDINDGFLVVDHSSSLPAVRAAINYAAHSSSGGGLPVYDRPGIKSTAAAADVFTYGIGSADLQALNDWGVLFGRTTFGDYALGGNLDTTLVRYTYAGDANLDGKVTREDYFFIDIAWDNWHDENGRLKSPSDPSVDPTMVGWMWGDFNNDGQLTGSDYFLIDITFDAYANGVILPLDSPPLTGGSLFGGQSGVLEVQSVPEPATLALLAMGVAGFAGRAIRRRRKGWRPCVRSSHQGQGAGMKSRYHSTAAMVVTALAWVAGLSSSPAQAGLIFTIYVENGTGNWAKSMTYTPETLHVNDPLNIKVTVKATGANGQTSSDDTFTQACTSYSAAESGGGTTLSAIRGTMSGAAKGAGFDTWTAGYSNVDLNSDTWAGDMGSNADAPVDPTVGNYFYVRTSASGGLAGTERTLLTFTYTVGHLIASGTGTTTINGFASPASAGLTWKYDNSSKYGTTSAGLVTWNPLALTYVAGGAPSPTLTIGTADNLRSRADATVGISGSVGNTAGTAAYVVTSFGQSGGVLTVQDVVPSAMFTVGSGASTAYTANVLSGSTPGVQAYSLQVSDGTTARTATGHLAVVASRSLTVDSGLVVLPGHNSNGRYLAGARLENIAAAITLGSSSGDGAVTEDVTVDGYVFNGSAAAHQFLEVSGNSAAVSGGGVFHTFTPTGEALAGGAYSHGDISVSYSAAAVGAAVAAPAAAAPALPYFVDGNTLVADVVYDNPLAGLSSTVNSTNHAELLAGKANASQQVGMNWREHTADEYATSLIVSDVLRLTLDVNKLVGETYMLEMGYDPNDPLIGGPAGEATLAANKRIYVAYLNGTTWENAGVLGQFKGVEPYPTGDVMVGDWGVDTASHTAWVVLDHASDFAVVPEPATLGFLILGGLCMTGGGLLRKRTHQASA